MEKDLFSSYFTNLGLTKAFQDRAETIVSLVEDLYNDLEFQDVFISNQMKDQVEDYSSLWLFSSEYVVECKNFLSQVNIDLAYLKSNLRYFSIRSNKETLASIQRDKDASLIVQVSTNDTLSCTLLSSGNNCAFLLKITNKYFLPNIIKHKHCSHLK